MNTPALTRGQRMVVELMVSGYGGEHTLSNRDIAERLWLSVRTVEGHLYRAYRRAHVHSRQELAALVGGSL